MSSSELWKLRLSHRPADQLQAQQLIMRPGVLFSLSQPLHKERSSADAWGPTSPTHCGILQFTWNWMNEKTNDIDDEFHFACNKFLNLIKIIKQQILIQILWVLNRRESA